MGDHDAQKLQLALEMVCWVLAFEFEGESEELRTARQVCIFDNALEQAEHELKNKGML